VRALPTTGSFPPAAIAWSGTARDAAGESGALGRLLLSPGNSKRRHGPAHAAHQVSQERSRSIGARQKARPHPSPEGRAGRLIRPSQEQAGGELQAGDAAGLVRCACPCRRSRGSPTRRGS